ncbi:SDR family oxidoreductase [Priestia megaterium]|uniref:glucose 1-dehydrogenase [NAD(P)(+)] n=1 Tax=Priestia megaterium (strain ATCC 14581 / DSM 32 / CCUG 1817 / JCM 2506 / NBRC 15308 / NCIMB 9376 / NCTC 10342 / NRRL B-14308 / VKM B-512 / Ford 19) TaxID=1348623 RepID=A0A0B6AIN1_PRIM2|nr:SDR family oxidoreductase [Priestia megaterium]AJI20897.1 short chain dehydrogenase family protein [Priestia megaterium NBRC 15308 = ATCC 14581]KFM97288.1 short chain dehydrogenase family protein [Priestia megaterium]KGJ78387.1 oxidoreductase [Priestia megaterium NBRC 15308 = ATCC 14581]MBU8753748.1 SDR family oxidoreductase [Priestia megaterium]MDR4232582.1 SDR family oxidoreductase [Priestia megaterium]
MKRLINKIAIVTGASRAKGIGTEICRELAREGADIFFTHWSKYDRLMDYFNEDDFKWSKHLMEEIRSLGVRCESMELDLSQPDAPRKLLDEVQNKLGSPSILVNNATHSVDVDFRSIDADMLDAHYNVNIRGTCLLTVEFARLIEGKHGGRIINMVSGQDKSPEPGNLAYVATKGAVSTFTKSVAIELAPLKITVNAVDPGPTNTGWMSSELKEELLSKFPMGRLGEPRDAAKLVIFLASEESEWITGQIIHSDGGFW